MHRIMASNQIPRNDGYLGRVPVHETMPACLGYKTTSIPPDRYIPPARRGPSARRGIYPVCRGIARPIDEV